MEVFKICREKFSRSLQASGVPNRWNKKDEFVIYSAGSRSLAALESVAHRSAIIASSPYKLLKISFPDEAIIKEIQLRDLPKDWMSIQAYVELQEVGSKWYHSQESLVLKVPSAIIKEEYNYVINTQHPLFKEQVILESRVDFAWDKRLL